MSFTISFLDDPVPKDLLVKGEEAIFGEIHIGDFHERLLLPTDYWSRTDYINQWITALGKITQTSKDTTSALITAMYDPAKANFIMCWPLFKEKDEIYIRNRLLFMNDVRLPFKIDEIGAYLGNRESAASEKDKISEWKVNVSELRECLTALKSDDTGKITNIER